MNSLRIVLSVFLIVLAVASIAGVVWASGLEPPPQIGGRGVLVLGALACLGARTERGVRRGPRRAPALRPQRSSRPAT